MFCILACQIFFFTEDFFQFQYEQQNKYCGVAGCYPKCPQAKPFFNEDTMKCVSWDQCGCYDEKGIHYNIGEQVPANNCYMWYMKTHPLIIYAKKNFFKYGLATCFQLYYIFKYSD